MTSDKIYEKIKLTYNSEKGKNFILHLIRSFLPINKSSYIWDSKPGSKCSITGTSLIGKEQAFKVFMDNSKEQFKHTTDKILEAFKDEKLSDKPTTQEESPVKKALNGKVLGIMCGKSDKLLCTEALEALQKFAIDQMLAGDKTIQYSVNQQRREENPHPKPFKKPEQKQPEVKRATTKLGDVSNLQALRDQLEKQENAGKN